MSSSVSYFHNILGREEAEERLVADGLDKTFLARRSPLNGDCYVLSYQSNGKFKHEIVNYKPVSRESVDLENVFLVLNEMVETNSDCENAVLPTAGQGDARHLHCSRDVTREDGHPHCTEEAGRAGHSQTHSLRRNKRGKRSPPVEPQTDETVDRPTVRPNIIQLRPQCYVCHQSFDNKRQRNDHLNEHKVRKCSICGFFFSSRNFASHFKSCSKTPAPKCTQCDYTTYRSRDMKRHVQAVHGKEFSCSDCGKTFSCKERLDAHAALHQGQHKCIHCPEVFKTVSAKYKHQMRKHTERRRVIINPNVGFFSIDTESIQAEQRKQKPVHHCDKCEYKSDHKGHYNEHVKMHSRSPKKRKRKKQEVFKCVKGCGYFTKNSKHFKNHLDSCRYYKCSLPSVRKMITNRLVCQISNKVSISNKKMKTILQCLEEQIGKDMFEKGRDQALCDNLNRLGGDYEVSQLEYKDGEGNDKKTAFVRVKDICSIIDKVIKKRKISKPLVVIGSDGGQDKLICTLQIHDLNNKSKDNDGLEPGGRRRVILLGAADGVKESRELMEHFCDELIQAK